MTSLQKESEWEKELKKSFLKELDFLSDHWVNGDDKPPFSFGGWREEVANEFVKITKNVVSNREKEIAEEVNKLEKEMPDRIDEEDVPGVTDQVIGFNKALEQVLQIIKH